MKKPTSPLFPPLSWQECTDRGWDSLDVLLVTGDAYVDHPSFGVAIIFRLLESLGYKVAILSQPRYDNADDFKQFPTPRLFCAITAGNLDSIVSNYTSSGKVRNSDSYSAGGNPWQEDGRTRKRPDRASIIFTSLAKSAFKDCPIVLGGIEASLRRFTHYDYKQGKLRASILTDAKADLLIFGMGERAITEIAKRRDCEQNLENIVGTCERLSQKELAARFSELPNYPEKTKDFFPLPSHAEILADKALFLDAELAVDKHARAAAKQIMLQKQQSHWLVQHPAAAPLNEQELDALYDNLEYTRRTHPSQAQVPALDMIKDSVTIVRGCSGNCSFCAITRHQGGAISSRSNGSIVQEIKRITQDKTFRGTISDLGGPTANLFATSCKIGGCKQRECLYPKVCANLEYDEARFLKLLSEVSCVEGVKNLFISSGLRMELLLKTPKLMEKIISQHTPGALQIAPEHTDPEVLKLMHKEDHSLLVRFMKKCQEIAKKQGKPVYVNPYIITAHPGSTKASAQNLCRDLQKLGLKVRAFQDFTPTPGSISTAMYVAERSSLDKSSLFVPKHQNDKQAQRNIVEKDLLVAGKKHPKKRKPNTPQTRRPKGSYQHHRKKK